MPVLNDLRKERFAVLIANGGDTAKAHADAGFRRKNRRGHQSGAAELRKQADVKARITELAEKAATQAIAEASAWLAKPLMDKVETLSRLQAIGQADLRKLLAWGGAEFAADGSASIKHANFVTLIESGKLDDATASAIAEVVQTADGTIRLKLHDKRAALRDYAKLQGWLTQKHEVSGAEGAPLTFTIKVGDDRSGDAEY
jgi:phage terminase small subunit